MLFIKCLLSQSTQHVPKIDVSSQSPSGETELYQSSVILSLFPTFFVKIVWSIDLKLVVQLLNDKLQIKFYFEIRSFCNIKCTITFMYQVCNLLRKYIGLINFIHDGSGGFNEAEYMYSLSTHALAQRFICTMTSSSCLDDAMALLFLTADIQRKLSKIGRSRLLIDIILQNKHYCLE